MVFDSHLPDLPPDGLAASAKVLIVEDDPTSRESWTQWLTLAGYEITTADDAASAVDAVRTSSFDLLIADQQLGNVSALELLRRFRATGVRTPVVIVTGFGSVENAVQAMKLGAVDYLQKPVDLDLLLNVAALALTASGALDSTQDLSSYAASRWASAIVKLMSAPYDVRTLEEWGREVGASAGTIRNWCRTARVPARRSLLLARFLRAVRASAARGWHPEQLLDVVDTRTLDKLLAIAGLPKTARHLSVSDFLDNQLLIRDADALDALRRAINKRLSPRS